MNREISAFSLYAATAEASPCAVTLWFYVQCAMSDWLYWRLWRSSPSGMWQFLEVELLGSQVAEISKLGFRVSRVRMNICSNWHSRIEGFTMQHHAATHQSGPLVSGLWRVSSVSVGKAQKKQSFASGLIICLITIWILRHYLGMSIREADSVFGEQNLCKLTGCLGLERNMLIGIFLCQQRQVGDAKWHLF